MTTFRNPRAGLILIALPALLSGCISLLPKTPPAQLYRFGSDPVAAPAQNTASAFAVRALPIGFERASATDRILTVDGDKTAYIGGARWITSADSLFEAAVDHAFAGHARASRLLARGETATPELTLKLDVRRFEVLYEHGPATAPTINVEVYAALDNPSNPAVDRERTFVATISAADNRVGAIVVAFDQAVDKVLRALVSWVDARGAN